VRPRYALFALACAVLLAAGLWVILGAPGNGAGAVRSAAEKPPPPALAPAEREALERAHARQQAADEDRHNHESAEPGVEAAARAFLDAYLPYEVGEIDGATEAALERTTTSEFGEQLLGSPPRFPPGLGKPPAGAELLAIDALPVSADRARIVAKLRRGVDLEAAAFELRRIGGHWLISGVTG
jgi:hypothetical protein